MAIAWALCVLEAKCMRETVHRIWFCALCWLSYIYTGSSVCNNNFAWQVVEYLGAAKMDL